VCTTNALNFHAFSHSASLQVTQQQLGLHTFDSGPALGERRAGADARVASITNTSIVEACLEGVGGGQRLALGVEGAISHTDGAERAANSGVGPRNSWLWAQEVAGDGETTTLSEEGDECGLTLRGSTQVSGWQV
jgi:hypothetical protein